MKYTYASEWQDQPDVKLKDYGARRLDLRELLAVIIQHGTAYRGLREIVEDVAKVLLENTYNTTMSQLVAVNGIGFAKATQILAAVELARRFPPELERHAILHSTDDVLQFVECYRFEKQEHVLAISLSGANEIINVHVITKGLVNQSSVHPREVLRPMIEDSAASFIMVHNHPSGSLEPSPADILSTERMKQAAEVVGITMLDHLIIGPKEPKCRSII